ncbi:unnamed protein product, partial [Cyprideis torosa]
MSTTSGGRSEEGKPSTANCKQLLSPPDESASAEQRETASPVASVMLGSVSTAVRFNSKAMRPTATSTRPCEAFQSNGEE